jgi:hypothetical protein
MPISPSDFSVIIQGPILGKPGDPYDLQLTIQCIESVRRVLPGSEIILSTWVGSAVSHLDYDKVVFSKDPGAVSYNDNNNKFNNNNRQILSTYNGLTHSSRKYSIKLRGDCKLSHSGFISLLNKYPYRSKYKFFKKRIITSTVFSLNPRKIPILFHISDIFQVGLTSDIKQLWDIPMQPEPITTRGGLKCNWNSNDPYPEEGYEMKFAAEQYIWFAFCKKRKLNLNLKFYSQVSIDKIVKSELSLINNFLILSPQEIGLVLPNKMIKFINYPFIYSSKDWIYLYNKYCISKVSLNTKLILIFRTLLISNKIKYISIKKKLVKIFYKVYSCIKF